MRRFGLALPPGDSRLFHAPAYSDPALNFARFAAYIAVSVNNERR